MLSGADIIETVADKLAGHPEIAKVIDPMMVATSGAKLLKEDAVTALKARLLPLATVITPNIPETEVLVGKRLTCRTDVRDAAKALYDALGAAILVKGGHAVGDLAEAEDTLFDGRDFRTNQR